MESVCPRLGDQRKLAQGAVLSIVVGCAYLQFLNRFEIASLRSNEGGNAVAGGGAVGGELGLVVFAAGKAEAVYELPAAS